YNTGSSVTVTAAANSGYRFVNWTEGNTVVSTSASYNFTISANRTLVANFVQQYTVTTSSNPTAGGTVTQSGSGTYNTGSSVTVTAAANSGYSFVNWTEGSTVVSANASYSFTISGNRTLVANFAISTYTLTVNAANGTVTKNPDQANYNHGATVQLTATPATGYTFTGWSGDAAGSTNPLTVTMNSNKNITANFAINTFTVTLSAAPAAGGIVTQSGTGTYSPGSSVTVTAAANSGYNFVSWTESGTVVSTGLSYSFIINSNRNLVANFTQAQYTVTLSPNPPAGGTLTGSGIYSFGQIVTVSATPNSGYQFVSWTEGGTVVSTGTNYAFIINSSRVLVANFALLSVLSVTPDFVNVNHPAGTTSFSVANTGSGTLNWSAVSNTSWITITGAGSGVNSGTINVSYSANTGNQRTGTITITATGASGSPKTVEVRQAMYTDVRDLNDRPETFNLYQNFPNPFNPTTNIRFNLSKDSMVSLKVYNILGQEIAQLINKEMPAGSYQYDFDASQLTSGLYIYKIQTENFVQAKKMLLMK
ncbi:MAG: InlB B-repeat-containing protein, partial [Bacteroidota bacterium]